MVVCSPKRKKAQVSSVAHVQLYYHKTGGGAEYLTDAFIECDNGHREGVFDGAKYIVRIDGDITKDAEMNISEE